MVRATAVKRRRDGCYECIIRSVQGTEAVYPELGRHLHARIVVDILSGTSAGGINSVCLAKAFDFGICRILTLTFSDRQEVSRY